MIDFKGGRYQRRDINVRNESRAWIRENYEGSHIGHGKLCRISTNLWEVRCVTSASISWGLIWTFLLGHLGWTYEDAWDKLVKQLKESKIKNRPPIREINEEFDDMLGLLGPSYRRANFILREGRIDYIGEDLMDFKCPKQSRKVMEYNGKIKVTHSPDHGVLPLDMKAYVVDPETKKTSPEPVKIYYVGCKYWNERPGKYAYYLPKKWTRVVVPGWEIRKGFFVIKNK